MCCVYVQKINFNPVGAGAAPVPGEVWLLNWGIDGVKHPNLVTFDISMLAGLSLAMLAGAFLLLVFHQRYVK